MQGEKALAWVRERNAESEGLLQARPGFDKLKTSLREVLDSREQIPYVSRRGDWLYNFWRDASNPRGLWRRTTLAEYRKPQPKWGNGDRRRRPGQGRERRTGSGAAAAAWAPTTAAA